MAKTINARMLKRHGACTPQYKLFLKYYGSTRSVEVTEEEAMKHAHDFDWSWAAKKFLNNNQYRLYEEAMEEALKLYNEAIAEPRKVYNDATKEAWKLYDEAMEEPWKLYNEAMEEALKLYNEAIAEPQKLYKVAIAEPQKVYNEAQVRAFVNAYNS